jgi:hypothetical protein
MWTPLLLICYVDSTDCAIPNAPAYFSEQECLDALDHAMNVYNLPEGMTIISTIATTGVWSPKLNVHPCFGYRRSPFRERLRQLAL